MFSPTAEHAYQPAAPTLDAQRRQRDLARWRRHSRFIGWLRRVLPALILAPLLGLLAWAGINTVLLRASTGSQAANMAIRMVNPRFLGRDQGGRPFFLGAASAERDANQPQQIYLDRPVATLGARAAGQTHAEADKGVYREDTRILTLDSHVRLHDANNDFLSAHAVVNTATSDVDGPAHIDGHGGFGHISANSYAVRDQGDHVYFNGRVSAHIIQGGSAAGASKGPR
jgi:lipopolysaccharide export system protein LptC